MRFLAAALIFVAFALHDSALTHFDAGDVVGRDLVKEIVEALRTEGLRVGFYHSLIDWHHAQYDFTMGKGLPYPVQYGDFATPELILKLPAKAPDAADSVIILDLIGRVGSD